MSAQDALTDTQKHWGIENRLHWVGDVTFKENFPLRRGGNPPVNWAILRNFFITLARFLGFRTIPQAQRAVFQSNPKGFFFLCMKPPCLPKSGEGRQRVALAGWGSNCLIYARGLLAEFFCRRR